MISDGSLRGSDMVRDPASNKWLSLDEASELLSVAFSESAADARRQSRIDAAAAQSATSGDSPSTVAPSHATESKQMSVSALRSLTQYSGFRGSVGILAGLGYIVCALYALASFVLLSQHGGFLLMLVSLGMAALGAVSVYVGAQLMLIVADIADALMTKR